MPRTRGVVNPPPVAPPTKPKPRAIQRSATDTTLPVSPPKTITRKRSRSRVTDSDTEDDEAAHGIPCPDVDDRGTAKGKGAADGALVLGNKKRKTLDAIAEELSEAQVEDAFWMGTSKDTKQKSASSDEQRSQYRSGGRSRAATRSPSSSPPPAPHLLQRHRTGLVSPPPSRRQAKIAPRPATPPPEASTSSRKLRSLPKRALPKRELPKRDSPDNPFLVDSPSAAEAENADEAVPSEPSTPKPRAEKPTMTWVFRGTRVEFANPLYRSPGSPTGVEEDERARLPPEHPDYSPPPSYSPKLLFPDTRRKARKARVAAKPRSRKRTPVPASTEAGQSKARSRSRSTSWDSSDDEGTPAGKPSVEPLPTVPEEPSDTVLQAAMAERIAHTARAPDPAPRTRTRAHGAPRIPEKDSDLVRRAIGPSRAKGPQDGEAAH